MKKICIVQSNSKLGDVIWHLPFVKAISDYHNAKVTLCIQSTINIKDSLEELDHIDEVILNFFRKGVMYYFDIFSFYQDLKKRKFDYIYMLEKNSRPAIAARLAGIKNIIGFGIGKQKKFLTNKFFLVENDLRYNYPAQCKKFLKINGIEVANESPFLPIKQSMLIEFHEKIKKLPRPWAVFGVDSSEKNRFWPQNNFAKLADLLITNNFAKTIFIINHQDYLPFFQNIKNASNFKENLVDCKEMNKIEIIKLMALADFFVGLDSGPSCVSAALEKKTFCIIGPTDASALKFKTMVKITSDIYDKSREVGIRRCGDNFSQSDDEVKRISVAQVFGEIKKYLI